MDTWNDPNADLLAQVRQRYDPVVLDWLLADTSGLGAWLAEHPTDPEDPVDVHAFLAELLWRAPIWLQARQLAFIQAHWPPALLPEDDPGRELLP